MANAVLPPCDESIARAETVVACRSERGTLVATVLGSSLAFVVGSIVNVALPAMQREFGTGAAGVQWIVNAYLLPLSALVLVGGALGDHYGRKRIFMLGLAIFGLATLGCALATTLETLLGARFVQGIGAALIAPNSLAIIAAAFSGEKRGRAVGTWAAASAVAGAAAPLAGGFIVDTFDWRWAFAIVIPPALAAWIAGARGIAESKEREAERAPLDIAGAVLATLSLASLVYALIGLPTRGWSDPALLAAGGSGIALAGGFLVIQHRKGKRAMMPLGIFGSGSFTGISILTLMLYAALGGMMVLLPYMLIESFGYSATAAGAALLPFPLIMGTLSRFMGGFAAQVGIRNTLTAGPLLVALGFALFALLSGPSMSYWTGILPGLVIMALGMAISVAPLTTAVMNAVDDAYVGIASGVNNAIARTAGLIATALLGLVLVDAGEGGGALVSGFANAAWVGAALAAASAATSFALVRESAVRG